MRGTADGCCPRGVQAKKRVILRCEAGHTGPRNGLASERAAEPKRTDVTVTPDIKERDLADLVRSPRQGPEVLVAVTSASWMC